MPALAPLLQRGAGEAHSIRARLGSSVEINVPVHPVVVIGPIPGQQIAGAEINDVGLEAETEMRLGTRALKLIIAAESEDIVADDVGLAVMLMKPAVGRAINNVAFGEDAAAAFVEIDAPAAVAHTRDVVPQIV